MTTVTLTDNQISTIQYALQAALNQLLRDLDNQNYTQAGKDQIYAEVKVCYDNLKNKLLSAQSEQSPWTNSYNTADYR